MVTVVQARTGSTRLPGKVLLPLGDATVLDVMLRRVTASRLAGTVVVATTIDPLDDGISTIARRHVPCYRGHPSDLLDRHRRAAALFRAEHVVKVPSDCPLIDPAVIDAVIARHLAGDADYTSNLHPPTHPDGNDVEIVRASVLEEAWREADRPFEREHTTPFIWNRPDRFRLANVAWSRDCSATHRLVLDYREDYEVIRAVHDALADGNAAFSADDAVRWLDDHPDVAAWNAGHRGAHWYNGHLSELPGLHGPAGARPALAL